MNTGFPGPPKKTPVQMTDCWIALVQPSETKKGHQSAFFAPCQAPTQRKPNLTPCAANPSFNQTEQGHPLNRGKKNNNNVAASTIQYGWNRSARSESMGTTGPSGHLEQQLRALCAVGLFFSRGEPTTQKGTAEARRILKSCTCDQALQREIVMLSKQAHITYTHR